jgi:hypothetical protein
MKKESKRSVIPLSAADKALIASVAAKLKGKILFPDRIKAAKEFLQNLKSIN